jgi:hypothetical protein
VRHRARWVGGWAVRLVAGLLTAAAIVVGALVIAVDRLPSVLIALAAHFVPGYDVELGGARLHGLERLELTRVRVRLRDDPTPFLVAKRLTVRASPWALRQGRIEELRIVGPLVQMPAPLAAEGETGSPAGGGSGGWSIGRLVVTRGRLRAAPAEDRPGLDLDLALDLRELGLDAERGATPHRLRLRNVRARLAGTPPVAVVRDVLTTVTLSGLVERRTVDAVRLIDPELFLPESLPTLAGSETDDGAGTLAGWRIGRLATHDGRLRLAPTAERPGGTLAFAFDWRDVGLDPALAERLHHLRLRDVRLAFGDRPPSLVVDAARTEFTLGGLLERRRLAALRVERGTLVVDGALRARLAGGDGGATASPAAATGWSVGVFDTGELGVRLSDLAPEVPDVTLRVHTTLRDVPLSLEALEEARDPQRVELADLTLYSPFDPFRAVVHIGNVLIDCTLAEVLNQRLGAITLLSPTIFLGEDLIWYMGASGGTASTATSGPPWTVDTLRAELGRIMVTFNGADRLALPITFRTHVQNVTLRDLATLRLAAALQVPRQTYRLPGLDVEFVDLHGELRFRYPPGRGHDNVVNVLQVARIRWRGYEVGDGWLSVTFDQKGINGQLGGQAYGGYVNGGGSLPFAAGPTSGWVSAQHLDLALASAPLAGERIEMTGAASFKGTARVSQGRLEAADGTLAFERPGRLSFPDLDTLVDRLPADAPGWQRDLAKIAVDAFRDYPYTTGEGTLRFADFRGEARLALDGERGARHVEAHYYQDAPALVSPPPRAP